VHILENLEAELVKSEMQNLATNEKKLFLTQ
jgi:hypothetical protein